ncbi:MAG TPA: hypothetical protein P5059_03805 [Candidatus Dojkabacteria bacterium]|nr:hypothetical protein [Candidatus Dojkabacteria bacterium]
MNIKITRDEHEWLESNLPFNEYLYGSRLLGNFTKDSDYDYLRIFNTNDIEYYYTTAAKYLPNVHALQYTENQNKQYVWMSERQFWANFFSGDGSMLTDIILFCDGFVLEGDKLLLCYSYKVIKGLLGITRRDLKKHKTWEKRVRYSRKSLYMAECLISKELPHIDTVKYILNESLNIQDLPSIQIELSKKESMLRLKLRDMLNDNQITFYPQFKEDLHILDRLIIGNNTKEFRYE